MFTNNFLNFLKYTFLTPASDYGGEEAVDIGMVDTSGSSAKVGNGGGNLNTLSRNVNTNRVILNNLSIICSSTEHEYEQNAYNLSDVIGNMSNTCSVNMGMDNDGNMQTILNCTIRATSDTPIKCIGVCHSFWDNSINDYRSVLLAIIPVNFTLLANSNKSFVINLLSQNLIER
jgi:hypothetical protein